MTLGQRLGSAPYAPSERATNLTPDGRLRSGRLAGRSMGCAIWVLGWPILVESFLNSLVGLTDTVLAAGLDDGRAATDAVGAAVYMLWLIGLVIMAIGVGATALVSRSVGAGRLAVANAAVGQTMLLAIGCGTAVGILIFAAAPFSARLFGMDAAAEVYFVTYLRILALGVPFQAVLFSGIACARGSGDNIGPLVSMVFVNLINLAVSWTLAGADLSHTVMVEGEPQRRVMLENPFGFDLGVRGIAIGTLVAEVVGAAYVFALLMRGRSGVTLKRSRLRPHWVTLKRLVRIGLPNLAETLGMWFGNFLIILLVGAMGQPGLLGAHMVAIRIEAFSFLPGFAMGGAAATLAGQYLGAGSPQRARRAIVLCTAVTLAFMGPMGLLFMFASRPLVGLFTPQPEHLAVVPLLIFIAGTVQIPFGLSIVTRTALRGAGDVKVVMWITWLTTYAIRLPLAYLLSGVTLHLPDWLGGADIPNPLGLEPSLAGLWIGLCIEIVLRAAIFGVRFGQASWTKQRV